MDNFWLRGGMTISSIVGSESDESGARQTGMRPNACF